MNDFLGRLLLSLASAFISAWVVILFRKFLEYLRHRALRAFWELPGGKAVIIRSKAIKRTDPDNPKYEPWTSDLFSTMAVETVEGFLIEKGLAKEVQIVGSNSPPADTLLRDNVVFIGGTLGNPVCLEECDHLQQSTGRLLPYYWHGQDVTVPGVRILRNADLTRSYATVLRDSHAVDHGLILKVRNHRNNERWMYVLAGNVGIGTCAAARFVTSVSKLKEFRKDCKRGISLCSVVDGIAKEFSLVQEPNVAAPIVRV